MKRQPRILLLTPDYNLHGGIERYTHETVEACIGLGAHIDAICVFDCSRPNSEAFTAKTLFANRSRNNLIIRRLWPRFLTLLLLCKSFPCDLIIAAHPYCLPSAVSLAKKIKRPCWGITYGLECWPPLSGRMKHAVCSADRIISISSFTKKMVADASGRTHSIDSIPCAVDTTHFCPAKRSRSTHGRGPIRLLSVSRLASYPRTKGHDLVLQSVKILLSSGTLPVHYTIAGDGDDRRRLECLVAKLGISRHVKFTGRVPDSDLPTLYKNCDVFVLPSPVERVNHRAWTGEGFGIVYIEAAACGKPVIACDSGGQTDCVVDDKTGLLVKPEVHAVANAIKKLAMNQETARSMGQAGREMVVEKFSIATFNRNWKMLLESDL